MKVEYNKLLKEKHTFGLESMAEAYVKVNSIDILKAALQLPYAKKIILGGGSNVIFTSNFKGLVIEIAIKGIKVIRSYKHVVHVSVGAGENWHSTVLWCLKNNFGGLQNLSLIPGKVGASPIQNIGAYGVELKDVFLNLKALELSSGKIKTFSKQACVFGYRDSFFKRKGKGKFVILEVSFSLTKNKHTLNTAYGAIGKELERVKVSTPTIQDVSKAVIKIRRSKLPDPKKIGNSGSFFKNPVIGKRKFAALQRQFPDVVHYPLPNGKIKLAAGWLIDQCQWKGKSIGDIAVHPKQALVLTNLGSGTAKQLLAIVGKIRMDVSTKFDVELETEVNLI